jgi:hypothetical protein
MLQNYYSPSDPPHIEFSWPVHEPEVVSRERAGMRGFTSVAERIPVAVQHVSAHTISGGVVETRDEVRRKAFEYYQGRRGIDGGELDDWLRAFAGLPDNRAEEID